MTEFMHLGLLNDLWSFEIVQKQWTWLSGTAFVNRRGIYGSQGVTAVTNVPGARHGHAMLIHPTLGGLLVFGGFGYDSLKNQGEQCCLCTV